MAFLLTAEAELPLPELSITGGGTTWKHRPYEQPGGAGHPSSQASDITVRPQVEQVKRQGAELNLRQPQSNQVWKLPRIKALAQEHRVDGQ